MPAKNAFESVRPRPVTWLPELAPSTARQNTAEALVKRFGLSEPVAKALSDAIVDHPAARASINSPERRRVPGGELIAIHTHVWTRRVSPDPANMRIGPAKVHPYAVAPGSGGEGSRFAPVLAGTSDPSGRPEIVCAIDGREQLEWAHEKAHEYVLRVNDWTDSIAVQGVMEEAWIVGAVYRHADGSPDLVVPLTAEGSSRNTAARDLVEAPVVQDIYGLADAALRAQIKRLNEALEMGALDERMEAVMRAFTMPALIIVGFEAGGSSRHRAVSCCGPKPRGAAAR